MPNILVPIPVTYSPVHRRVAMSVIENVMRITGIDKSTRVELRGDLNVATQPGGELGDVGKTLRFQNDGRLIVTAQETYRESEVLNTSVRQPNIDPIFEDRAIGVHIKPVYSYTDVELSFTYRAKTRQEVTMWRDDIKVRIGDNRQQHLHELDYMFPIPPWCALLLKEVYTRREAVAGYGETLNDYLKAHYTKNATVIATQDGDASKAILVVAEKQIGVQGWFDFIEPVEAEKNEDGPMWQVQFIYRFNYQKPVELNAQYPLVVHNQLIDDKFIPKLVEQDPDKKRSYKGMYKWDLDNFDYTARQAPRKLGGIAIPDFDEWIPDNVVNYTTTFISWMVVVEPRDLQLIMGTQDILDTGFHPSILAYMRKAGNKLVQRGQCALHLALYRENDAVVDGDLEIVVTDKAFDVRTKSMPDPRLKYHLRLSFCTNLSLYPEAALLELHEDGFTTLRMFQTVMNRLDVEYAQANEMTDDGKLSISYIKRFFKLLRDQLTGYKGNATDYGKDVNNNRLDDDSWLGNDENFHGRLDRPYVEILTILAGKRPVETNDAAS